MSVTTSVTGALLAGITAIASAQNSLNVLCPVQAEWCTLAATEFAKTAGIKVSMTLKGSGKWDREVASQAK